MAQLQSQKTDKAIANLAADAVSVITTHQGGRAVRALAAFAGLTTFPTISQLQDMLAEGILSQKDYNQIVGFEMGFDDSLQALFTTQGQQIADRQKAGLNAAIKLNLQRKPGESLVDYTTRATSLLEQQQGQATQAGQDFITGAQNQADFEQRLVQMGVAINDPSARERFFRTHPNLKAESDALDAAQKAAAKGAMQQQNLAQPASDFAIATKAQAENVQGTLLPGSIPPETLFPKKFNTDNTQTQSTALNQPTQVDLSQPSLQPASPSGGTAKLTPTEIALGVSLPPELKDLTPEEVLKRTNKTGGVSTR